MELQWIQHSQRTLQRKNNIGGFTLLGFNNYSVTTLIKTIYWHNPGEKSLEQNREFRDRTIFISSNDFNKKKIKAVRRKIFSTSRKGFRIPGYHKVEKIAKNLSHFPYTQKKLNWIIILKLKLKL